MGMVEGMESVLIMMRKQDKMGASGWLKYYSPGKFSKIARAYSPSVKRVVVGPCVPFFIRDFGPAGIFIFPNTIRTHQGRTVVEIDDGPPKGGGLSRSQQGDQLKH